MAENKVIGILMARDGLDRTEAEETLRDVQGMIEEALDNDDLDEVEDIIMGELGLEPDYVFDILGL